MIWTAKHVHVWDYQIGLPLYALLANVSQTKSTRSKLDLSSCSGLLLALVGAGAHRPIDIDDIWMII